MKNTDKIDIQAVGKKLSPNQCDIAIAIWRRMGVFEALSDDVKTLQNFSEEKIWERTFYNYTNSDADCNKMYRLTSNVIEHYKISMPHMWNDVARVVKYVKGMPRNIICKPSKLDIHRDFNFRINTAATHAIKSHRIQEVEPSIPISAVAQLVIKCCDKLEPAERIEWCNMMTEAAESKRLETTAYLKLLGQTDDLAKECHEKDSKPDDQNPAPDDELIF